MRLRLTSGKMAGWKATIWIVNFSSFSGKYFPLWIIDPQIPCLSLMKLAHLVLVVGLNSSPYHSSEMLRVKMEWCIMAEVSPYTAAVPGPFAAGRYSSFTIRFIFATGSISFITSNAAVIVLTHQFLYVVKGGVELVESKREHRVILNQQALSFQRITAPHFAKVAFSACPVLHMTRAQVMGRGVQPVAAQPSSILVNIDK